MLVRTDDEFATLSGSSSGFVGGTGSQSLLVLGRQLSRFHRPAAQDTNPALPGAVVRRGNPDRGSTSINLYLKLP
jgi:hypothetical protein